MNELDYVRDNRLRLWMIGRELPEIRDPKFKNKEKNFEELMRAVCERLGNRIIDRWRIFCNHYWRHTSRKSKAQYRRYYSVNI